MQVSKNRTPLISLAFSLDFISFTCFRRLKVAVEILKNKSLVDL